MPQAEAYPELRAALRELCAPYPAAYWRELDRRCAYPDAFVAGLTAASYLGALIPREYGGRGMSLVEASIIVEEINRSGGNAGPYHAQTYTMGTILRHGSADQKQAYLPAIARGELRLQAFGVTEPDAGSDTASVTTTAIRARDRYRINGRKIYISRVQHSDLLLLLARTTPREQVRRRTDGLSIFLVDLRETLGHGLSVTPIPVMVNNETNELCFTNVEVPAENLIGDEGHGFRYLLDGLNAERILIAAECIGDGRWFVTQATARARERVVFGRPIGQNQGVQLPIALAHIHVEAADLMRFRAAALFDDGQSCGAKANIAKLLAADASWEAANVAMQTFGGYGLTVDYDVERKFRETRLYQIAPVSTNLILARIAEHELGLPRSY
jgi:acyl-CoA dehydrogenase